jgi:hypothetical protein
MKIIINIEGNNGEHLYEVERELEYDIVNDKLGKGSYVVMMHPNEDLVLWAVNRAEDHLNENPELWVRETEPADYSGATEGDR